MQDKYISLDLQSADELARQQRKQLVPQRPYESKGGECASVFGMQCAITATVLLRSTPQAGLLRHVIPSQRQHKFDQL